jgi:hypothetical protein
MPFVSTQFTERSVTTVAVTIIARPSPLSPDPAGTKNVGNGHGGQFITGACLSDADCGSGCCAALNGGGICSGKAVAFAQGKKGCGFGGSKAPPQKGSSSSGTDSNEPGAQNVGNGKGLQFITGRCLSNADCGSGCCAKLKGKGQCSGPDVAFDAWKQGCGFVGNA